MRKTPKNLFKRMTPETVLIFLPTAFITVIIMGIILSSTLDVIVKRGEFVSDLLILASSIVALFMIFSGILMSKPKVRKFAHNLVLLSLFLPVPMLICMGVLRNVITRTDHLFLIAGCFYGTYFIIFIYLAGAGLIGWACWLYSKPWKEREEEF